MLHKTWNFKNQNKAQNSAPGSAGHKGRKLFFVKGTAASVLALAHLLPIYKTLFHLRVVFIYIKKFL